MILLFNWIFQEPLIKKQYKSSSSSKFSSKAIKHFEKSSTSLTAKNNEKTSTSLTAKNNEKASSSKKQCEDESENEYKNNSVEKEDEVYHIYAKDGSNSDSDETDTEINADASVTEPIEDLNDANNQQLFGESCGDDKVCTEKLVEFDFAFC